MKLLASLILLLSLALPSLAATVFPASTNGNNVFTGANTMTNMGNILGGNGATITNATSTNVFYSSKLGCPGDTSLSTGGGTDVRNKLQWALDQATNGGRVELVLETPCLISTGLVLRSGTHIRGITKSAGLYLADGSHSPMLWTAFTNCPVTNVILESFTINGNEPHQTNDFYWVYRMITNTITGNSQYWINGIDIHGSDNVSLRNLVITNCGATNQSGFASGTTSGFGVMAANTGSINIENCKVWRRGLGGHDCYHFCGPLGEVRLSHCRGYAISGSGTSADDSIAFNLYEMAGFSIETNPICKLIYIDDYEDLDCATSIINFSSNGQNAGNENKYGITNSVFKNISSNHSRIEIGEPGFGLAGVMYNVVMENIRNTALSIYNRRCSYISVDGFFYNTPVAGLKAPFDLKQTTPFYTANGYPFLPCFRFANGATNIVIKNLCGFWNGVANTNTIVAQFIWDINNDTNMPYVNINGATIRGNSPIYGDFTQALLVSGGTNMPKGHVVMDNLNLDSVNRVVVSNCPGVLIVSGVVTNQ